MDLGVSEATQMAGTAGDQARDEVFLMSSAPIPSLCERELRSQVPPPRARADVVLLNQPACPVARKKKS